MSLYGKLAEYRRLFPSARRVGSEHVGPCPVCGGDDRFWIRPDGLFGCRGCEPGERNTDAYKQIDAILSTDTKQANPKHQDSQRRDWVYADASGRPVMRQVRIDYLSGRDKVLFVEHWNGEGWIRGFPRRKTLRPLLYLQDLVAEPTDPVWLSEGEKCTDALRHYFPDQLCTTTSGGSSAWRRTDLAPLHGRSRVVLWADNDVPGRKMMYELGAQLAAHVGEVVVVDVSSSDLAKGSDIYDWLSSGGPKKVAELLSQYGKIVTPSDGEKGSEYKARSGKPSHLELATVFEASFLDQVVWDVFRLRWLVWNGHTWQPDDKTLVREQMRKIIASDKKWERCSNASFIRGAEEMVRYNPAFRISGLDLDADPWKVGCPDGVLELHKDGSWLIRPGKQKDWITRSLLTTPDMDGGDGGESPRWKSFLQEVTCGDKGKEKMLLVYLGACLTGLTGLRRVLYLTGTGKNGKSIFVDLSRKLWGTYGDTASADVFIASKYERHPAEKLCFENNRLVASSEIPVNRVLNSVLLKTITGGDAIAVRGMGENFRQIVPTAKVILMGNGTPDSDTIGPALEERMLLCNFDLHLEPEDMQHDLLDVMLAEGAGVLRDILERGYKVWREDGQIERPESVREATAEYFDNQDMFALWVNDRCIVDKRVLGYDLYDDYSDYMTSKRNLPISRQMFGRELTHRGYAKGGQKKMSGKVYKLRKGICLQSRDQLRDTSVSTLAYDYSDDSQTSTDVGRTGGAGQYTEDGVYSDEVPF